jgi:D-glycero-alpha-D-manno-heptose-7-phosphate kinase
MRRVHASAPTRIDFGGGWTDVPPYTTEAGGCVCNLAIARYASVTLSAPSHPGIIIDDGGILYVAPDVEGFPPAGGAEMAYAALRHFPTGPVALQLRSDFPRGAGLGGSSAAGVALVSALSTWCGTPLERCAAAEQSRAIEVRELKVAGGSQDHYAAALGGALALHFGDSVTARSIPLTPALVAALEQRCILAYTGETRISGRTITAVIDAYRARAPRVTNALARMRALAEQMIQALERGAVDALGALVTEHWEHQRMLHTHISTPNIERVLATARAAGAIGGKALGASGGGSVLVMAPAARAAQVRAAVAEVAEILPFTIDTQGARVSVETEDE